VSKKNGGKKSGGSFDRSSYQLVKKKSGWSPGGTRRPRLQSFIRVFRGSQKDVKKRGGFRESGFGSAHQDELNTGRGEKTACNKYSVKGSQTGKQNQTVGWNRLPERGGHGEKTHKQRAERTMKKKSTLGQTTHEENYG